MPGTPAQGNELRILYQDEWIVAVDKPAGIIVHGDGTGRETLTDHVRAWLLQEGREREAVELQPLQRLDRETTGIVLFSTSKEAQPAFDALIAGRGMEKRYLAIVCGGFPREPQTFDDPIGRDRHDARRMRVSATGKPALTEARRLAYAAADARGPERSLLVVDLHTGRRHQIRVHLSHAGYPILGDELYGRSSARELEQGLMLHASEEAFDHPKTGRHVCIATPYPERFEALFPSASLQQLL